MTEQIDLLRCNMRRSNGIVLACHGGGGLRFAKQSARVSASSNHLRTRGTPTP